LIHKLTSIIIDADAFTTQYDRTLFSKLATTFDSAVISLLSQNEVAGVPEVTLQAFQKSYASTAFRCRYPYCTKSSAGFASQQLRTQHEAGHFHRVYCKVESCQWSRIGFEKKSGLDSHTRKYHNERFTFPIPPKVRRALEEGAIDREMSFQVGDDKDDLPKGQQLKKQQTQQPRSDQVYIDSIRPKIFAHYRNQQQKISTGWQQTLPSDQRALLAVQYAAYCALLEVIFSEQKMMDNAVNFETQAFLSSNTRSQYVSQMQIRFQEMQDSYQRNYRLTTNPSVSNLT
jgi:hypothetical protein